MQAQTNLANLGEFALQRSFEDLIKIKDWTGILALANKTLTEKPKSFAAWSNKGFAYFSLSDNENAIISYKEALSIKEKVPLIWNNLGASYRRLGRLKEAIAAFEEAIRLQPTFELALTNLWESLDWDVQHFLLQGIYEKLKKVIRHHFQF